MSQTFMRVYSLMFLSVIVGGFFANHSSTHTTTLMVGAIASGVSLIFGTLVLFDEVSSVFQRAPLIFSLQILSFLTSVVTFVVLQFL